jgi:hypothetical protein
MAQGGSMNYDNAIHMMEKLGGSFVRSLAICYHYADPTNKVTLRTAFESYFEVYDFRFKAWQRDQAKEALQATREVAS